MGPHTHPSPRTAAVGVLAAACILGLSLSGSPAHSLENTLSIARTEEVEEATKRFQASLRSAVETGEAARQKWPKVVWEGLRCYDPAPVSRTLEQMKSDIYVAASGDPKLVALRAYLDSRLERIGRMPPMMIITQPGAAPGQLKRVIGVRADQADMSWQELREFAESFMGEARLAGDLSLTSDPSGAQIELRAVSGAVRKLAVTSDVQLRNLWRGVYRVSVDKAGYKPAALDLDLVSQRVTALSCTLARTKSPEASRCVQGTSR